MGIYKMLPKTGEHEERDASGVTFTYKAGDVLESDRDLVAIFPNKFLRVDTEVALGGGVPQPTIPVPHRFILDDVLVKPSEDVETRDVKPGETGDVKPGETGDVKPGETGKKSESVFPVDAPIDKNVKIINVDAKSKKK